MKLYKSLFLMTVVVATALFSSCSDEGYWEKYEIEGTQYSFAQSKQSFSLAASDSLSSISVTVYRNTTKGAATLPLSVEVSDSTVLVADSVVTFADGEDTAELLVAVVDSNIVMGTTYTVDYAFAVDAVNFTEANYSISGNNSHSISLKKDYTWETLGVGYYASQLFGQGWEQPILYAKEQPTRYRLPDCIYAGYPFEFLLSEDGQTLLEWEPQATGYKDADYGMVYYAPASMTRAGNTLSFTMYGLVVYNGGLAALYQGFVETIVLPSAE